MGCGASKKKEDKKKPTDSAKQDASAPPASASPAGGSEGDAAQHTAGPVVVSKPGSATGPAEVHEETTLLGLPGDGVFDDEAFPPTESSVHQAEDDIPPGTAAIAKWLRSKDINGDAALFVDGAEGGDVKQGGLASCWFLGALCVLATQDDLLRKVFPSHDLAKGYAALKFFKESRWIDVEIDDQLPVQTDNKSLVFASCIDPKEFWVPLAEKAYAKVHHSYGALTLGTIGTGLVDLTGGVHIWRDLTTIGIDARDKFWGEMRSMVTSKSPSRYLLGCSIPGSVEEHDESTGLLKGHAYAVVACEEVEGNRLVCIRNPWGHGEWKGAWSDNAPEWTDSVKNTLGHSFGNDGKFYMSYSDFIATWGTLDICRILTGEWSSAQVPGAWKGETAAGMFQHANGKYNPQYLLDLSADAEVILSLTQYDPRYSGDDKTKNFNIGLDVFNTETGQSLTGFDRGQLVKQSPSWSDQREATLELPLKAGKYVIVPSTYFKGEESSFIIRAYASNNTSFSVTPLASVSDLYDHWTADGKWDAETAGGSTMTRTWHKNPQHLITIKHREPPSGEEEGGEEEVEAEKVPLKMSLQQQPNEKGGKLHGISAMVQKGASEESGFGRPVFDRDPVVPVAQFVNREEVWSEFTAEIAPSATAVQYSVVPFTFHADELASYSLSVWAPKGLNDKYEIEVTNADASKWQSQDFSCEWKGPTAGGCANNPKTWEDNPTLHLVVKEDDTTVNVQLIQGENSSGKKYPIGLHILGSDGKPVAASAQWTPNFDTAVTKVLAQGEYKIRPSTFDVGQEGPFDVIVRSTNAVSIELN